MDRHIEFVKEQIANQEKLAAKFADQPHRAGLHYATAARFRELISELQKLPENRKDTGKKINVSLSDLDGLPAELMAELSISEVERQEMTIEYIIENNSGVISLDKLIIEYFKRENEILKRNSLTSRLFRMAEKGMIFNVPGKRGFYSVFEMTDGDVERVFGKPERTSLPEGSGLQEDQIQEFAAVETSPTRNLRLRRRFSNLE